MHDLGYLVSSLGTLIGTLILAYQAWGKTKRNTTQDEIRELKSERDEQKANAELYHQRWLKAEAGNDELRKKIDYLRKKIEQYEKYH